MADGQTMFDVDAALMTVIETESSDLHLKVPAPPMVRRYGKLVPIEGSEQLRPGVIEIAERGNRVSATSFAWNLFLVCGDSDEAGRYFGGWQGPVAPISCPDNLTFDSVGNLWIATDGAPGSISKADGLFRVPLEGAERGRVVQFLAVPYHAETCGPVIHDRDGSVFVAVQHPGEEGSWDDQLSYFPDYLPADAKPRPGAWRGPRPSVVQVTRKG